MSPSSPAPTEDEVLIRDPEGGIGRLVAIMARLRDPERGCPWDIEQDFDSIAPYTIEEAYEVADAIARRDHEDLRDELGDLLFQVVYHAAMAEEEGRFGFAEVVRGISDKMLRRHPHVFGDESRDKSAEQQTRDWERIKAAERHPPRPPARSARRLRVPVVGASRGQPRSFRPVPRPIGPPSDSATVPRGALGERRPPRPGRP